jgi:hypothetical protein
MDIVCSYGALISEQMFLVAHVKRPNNQVIIGVPNKPLVPTRNGETPLLAAQSGRWG